MRTYPFSVRKGKIMRRPFFIFAIACVTLFAAGFVTGGAQAQPPGAGEPPPWEQSPDPWDRTPPPQDLDQPPMGPGPPPRGAAPPPRRPAPQAGSQNPFVGFWVGFCDFGVSAANTDSTEVTLEVRERNGRTSVLLRNGLGTRDQLFHDHTAEPGGNVYPAKILQGRNGQPVLLVGDTAFRLYGNRIESYKDNGHNTHHYRLWRVR